MSIGVSVSLLELMITMLAVHLWCNHSQYAVGAAAAATTIALAHQAVALKAPPFCLRAMDGEGNCRMGACRPPNDCNFWVTSEGGKPADEEDK
eukprot:2071880-Heterocapsa_arctica.AAC.1